MGLRLVFLAHLSAYVRQVSGFRARHQVGLDSRALHQHIVAHPYCYYWASWSGGSKVGRAELDSSRHSLVDRLLRARAGHLVGRFPVPGAVHCLPQYLGLAVPRAFMLIGVAEQLIAP
eukprot:scaffold304842_cov33-Tisochrysis_lutea.AAC.4